MLRSSLVAALAVVAIVVLLFVVAWVVVPDDTRGVVLLASVVLGLVLYAGLYALQRRLHW
jgi:hypothetical protein